MITAATSTRQPQGAERVPLWQRELARAVTDPLELCRLLELDPGEVLAALPAHAQFRLRVPRGFVARMRMRDPCDPLLRQVLPLAAELLEQPGFGADPLDEQRAVRTAGLLHKYRGRALLIGTGACAVHCRYCFRREFPYADALDDSGPRFQAALTALAADRSIKELIVSGGDPLILGTARLAELTEALRSVKHLRRLRLHTRVPVVLPERVDEELLEWLSALPWPVVIVLHCNHANEIDAAVRAAAARLRATGATLLNQAVLLAGVNDSADSLEALSEALWSAAVLPYYLHLLDRVRGSGHFEVDTERARLLMAQLAARLPGYLVPRLVRETPGAPAKTPIAPAGWELLHSSATGKC
jgi:EF-P beta-lysylation protein EpmB